ISLTENGSPTETGAFISITGVFSDPNQDPVQGPIGAGWLISWGDGNSNTVSPQVEETFGTSHQYAEQGHYNIEVDATYQETGTETYWRQTIAHESADVAPGNPSHFTMNTSHSAWSNSVGVGFSFLDADGDTPTYTVSWGDGSTSTGTQPGFGHTYAYSSAAQTFAITGSATTDDGTFQANGGAASTITIAATTISLTGGGVATEKNQQPADIFVNRDGDTSQPLFVGLSFGGTEDSGEYKAIDVNTGQVVSGGITIPANAYSE